MVTIDAFPDDVLLEIFDFSVVKIQDPVFLAFDGYDTKWEIESWQSLVHVCRRWRNLVFGSPRRLNLQLCWSTKTPATETLNVWPALPLLVVGNVFEESVDNVIAELEHNDRISQINLYCRTPLHIEKLWTAMEAPFPELAVLYLSFEGLPCGPDLPDSFLGGSAPRLQCLALTSISFPRLPNLLLSAPHLVRLWLLNIPHSGYISPEAMATSLSVLTGLEDLHFRFHSP